MELFIRTLGNAAGLWAASALFAGLSVPEATTGQRAMNFLIVGLVLAGVNSLIKPVAKVLAFPAYLLTFGLFALVVNGAMLMITSWVTDHVSWLGHVFGVPLGLHVSSFGTAVWSSLLIAIISSVVVGFLGRHISSEY